MLCITFSKFSKCCSEHFWLDLLDSRIILITFMHELQFTVNKDKFVTMKHFKRAIKFQKYVSYIIMSYEIMWQLQLSHNSFSNIFNTIFWKIYVIMLRYVFIYIKIISNLLEQNGLFFNVSNLKKLSISKPIISCRTANFSHILKFKVIHPI